MQSDRASIDLEVAENYLAFLGQAENGARTELSLRFLSQLVRVHLCRIPYENVSKLIVPNAEFDFQTYLAGIQKAAFGGTCFAHSQGFCELLCALGFKAQIVLAKEGLEISHPVVCVTLPNGARYLIDLGLCADFAGPFQLQANHRQQTRLGDRTFYFAVNENATGFSLWITAGKTVVRSFQGALKKCSPIELKELIQESTTRSALMMQHLCIHQVFEDSQRRTSKTIWDRTYIETCGPLIQKLEIRSAEDLVNLAAATFGFAEEDISSAISHLKTTLRF